ncbi:Inositol transporter 1 [Galdieria sulphuraria]|nr:Inositol transporter 1 [Galdieria sulphuraria]
MSGIELQEDADVQKTQDTEIVYNNREKQDYVTQLEASLDEEEVKKELEILKEESLKFTGFSFRTHTLFKKGGRHMTLILGIFASIGGFIFGMDQGVISGALLFMPKDLSLTSGEESMVTGFMPLGAVLGATIAYPLNEWLGRKISIIIACFDTEEERNEFYIMKKTVERELRNSKDRWIIMDLIRVHRCRHAAIFGAIIAILEQFSGINSINYYMSTLMHEVGFSRVHAVYSSMIGSGTLLLFTIPAIYLMDRMGRRALWLSLLPGVVIGCFIIGFSFRASNIHIEEGIYIWGIITYYMFWGSGMGPYTWVIGSEIFPTYIRSEGMALVTWWTYIGNFLTTYLFTRMKTAMTGPGIFIGFYGGFVVLSWFYGLLMMPETKDKTLEEIDALFSMSMPALAKHNWNNAKKTTNDLLHFRLKEVWKIE